MLLEPTMRWIECSMRARRQRSSCRSRGVRVYYVMTSHGRTLRLVRTRWGWGGSPEIE